MLYILPKKLLVCVVVIVGMLYLTTSVAAQTYSDVSVGTASTVNIHADGGGEATFSLNVKNNSANLVKNISLPVLMGSVTGVEVKLGGSPVYFTTDTNGEFTVVNIDLQLAAIRPGAEAKIDVRIVSTRLIQAKFGIYEFLQPRISADFVVTGYSLDLTYPADAFPPLAYSSALDKDPQPNKIVMDSKSGFWLVWGNDAIIDLKGTVQLEGNDPALVNLIPELPNQEVIYKQVDKINGLVRDRYTNLWALINPLQFNGAIYEARVHNLPSNTYSLVEIDYPQIELPEIIRPLLESRSTEEKVNLIYTYLVDTYQPQTELVNKPLKFSNSLPGSEQALQPVEYTYYLASLLNQVGIKSNIVYGFYFSQFKSFNNLNLTLPQVWLEVLDTEVKTYDPYFQELTGWKGINASHINRVVYGRWDPQNSRDNILGLLTGKIANNPQIVELGEITNNLAIEVNVNFPDTILSGTYYEGKLTITNKSAIPLVIESISLDGQDISEQLLTVNNDFTLVARPNGITEITIPQYMNLDVLGARTKTGRVTVKAKSDVLVPQIAKYEIKFVPNYGLTAGIVVSTAAVIGLLLIFLFRRQVLIKLLKRQYYRDK